MNNLSMENFEKIQGQQLQAILDQINRYHIILKIVVPASGYEGLTMFLNIEKDSMMPSFTVERPPGIDSRTPVTPGNKCHFEFNGPDKIRYNFTTSVIKVEKDDISLNLPEFIRRIQRRKHFRVKAPSGTKLICKIMDKRMEFDVLNISEGGIYIGHQSRYYDDRILFEGGELSEISIIADDEEIRTKFQIKSAEIVRFENHKNIRKHVYGLRIIEIVKNEADKIRKFIYDCQRRVLKRRDTVSY